MSHADYIVNSLRWNATHWFARMTVGKSGNVVKVCTEALDRHNDPIALYLFLMDEDDGVIWITDYAETFDDLTLFGCEEKSEIEIAMSHLLSHVEAVKTWPENKPFIDDSPMEPAWAIYIRVTPETLNAGINELSALISKISNSFDPVKS